MSPKELKDNICNLMIDKQEKGNPVSFPALLSFLLWIKLYQTMFHNAYVNVT